MEGGMKLFAEVFGKKNPIFYINRTFSE